MSVPDDIDVDAEAALEAALASNFGARDDVDLPPEKATTATIVALETALRRSEPKPEPRADSFDFASSRRGRGPRRVELLEVEPESAEIVAFMPAPSPLNPLTWQQNHPARPSRRCGPMMPTLIHPSARPAPAQLWQIARPDVHVILRARLLSLRARLRAAPRCRRNIALIALRFPACPRPEYQYEDRVSGHSAAWLARPSGGRKVESSNLSGPTKSKTARLRDRSAGVFVQRMM